jgi:hypothetical protein
MEIIRLGMGKEPVQLLSPIWEPLWKNKLAQTPREYQRELLRNARVVAVTETTETLYSKGLMRALKAMLLLDERTQLLRPSFRSGHTAGLDLLLDNSDLILHDRCLNFHQWHERTPCRLSSQAAVHNVDIDTFSCNHIITDLYNLLLIELQNQPGSDCSKDDSFRLKVSQSLDEMPRKIEIAQGLGTGELQVSWVDGASDAAYRLNHLDIKGRITLHRESTCFNKRKEFLSPQGAQLGVDISSKTS